MPLLDFAIEMFRAILEQTDHCRVQKASRLQLVNSNTIGSLKTRVLVTNAKCYSFSPKRSSELCALLAFLPKERPTLCRARILGFSLISIAGRRLQMKIRITFYAQSDALQMRLLCNSREMKSTTEDAQFH